MELLASAVASAKRRGRTASPTIVCATPSALSCALRIRSGSPPYQVTRWSATIDRPGSPKMPSRRTWPLSPRRAGPLHDLYAGVGDGPQHRVEGSDASTLAARAAALQTTDPPAAALWAQLDKQLTGFAIWLPTVTPNETASSPAAPATTSTTQSGEPCSTSSSIPSEWPPVWLMSVTAMGRRCPRNR